MNEIGSGFVRNCDDGFVRNCDDAFINCDDGFINCDDGFIICADGFIICDDAFINCADAFINPIDKFVPAKSLRTYTNIYALVTRSVQMKLLSTPFSASRRFPANRIRFTLRWHTFR